jgi:RNA polymerase sigma factor (sigma-70 family)
LRNRFLDARSGDWLGDLTMWLKDNANSNSDLVIRLQQNLTLARQQELTRRQQEVLTLYFDEGMTMPQIARQLDVSSSTISRTVRRAKRRLYKCLKYCL